MKPSSRRYLPAALASALLIPAALASAQQENAALAMEEIVVTGSLRSLPGEDVQIFGFGKSLLETPRSASTISSEQMARFNVNDIDELIAFAPGTFTQSFFGVAGSLEIRGTPGETYFRGVRRLDNPGNYPTPIGASDRIDVVRGPASPIFGPSKIGGYINFNPKSARGAGGGYLEGPTGSLEYTTGSWDRNVLAGEFGTALGDDKGVYLYGEIEDSDSYYNNTTTEQAILQVAFDWDLSDTLRMEAGGMYHDYTGNQVAGWNRLTQELIDDSVYITGNAQPLDTDSDGLISHQEYLAVSVNPFFFRPEFVSADALPAEMALVDTGTTRIRGSDVLVAEDDGLDSEVVTLYFDLMYDAGNGLTVKNQLFYESYENLSENAYGFSQFSDSWVVENKLVFAYQAENSLGVASLQFSPSVRYTEFERGDDYTNEYFDRRDLTGPSTALDARLLSTQIGRDYTEYHVGDYLISGLAFLADMEFHNGLDLMAGVRYDRIDIDAGTRNDLLLFPLEGPFSASTTEEELSWTISASYELPFGLRPYITVSEQGTIIAGQGAEIVLANVLAGQATDVSELFEYGIKGSFLDDSLYLALSWYEQERTDFSAQNIVTNQSALTEGIEAEVRWVVNEKLVLTAGWTNVEVTNLTAQENGNSLFSFFGAEDLPQVDPSLIFGGAVIGFPVSPNARREGIPENIYTLTGTYAFNDSLAVNASVIRADETFSGFSRAVRLPDYTLVNAGVTWERDAWSLSLTGKNLTDERYFRSNFPDLFGSQIVLRELPRNVVAKVSYAF
jgi:iron complex outermembrane receptor protein